MAIPKILSEPVSVLQAAYNRINYCFRSTNYLPPVSSSIEVHLNMMFAGNYYDILEWSQVEFFGQIFYFKYSTFYDPLAYEISIAPFTNSAVDEENNLYNMFKSFEKYSFFSDFYTWSMVGVSPNRYVEIVPKDPSLWEYAIPGVFGVRTTVDITPVFKEGTPAFFEPNFRLGMNVCIVNTDETFLMTKTGVVVIDPVNGNQYIDACFDVQNFVQPYVKTDLPDIALLNAKLSANGMLFAYMEYFEIFGEPPLPQIKYSSKLIAVINAAVNYPHLENKLKGFSPLDSVGRFRFLTEIPSMNLCKGEKNWLYLALPSKFKMELEGKLFVRNKNSSGATIAENIIDITHERGVMIIPTHKAALQAMGVNSVDLDGCYYMEWKTIAQNRVIGDNVITMDHPFTTTGEVSTDVVYAGSPAKAAMRYYKTGTVLTGIDSLSLEGGKIYKASMNLKEDFGDVAGGAYGNYSIVPRGGYAHGTEVVTVMGVGQNADTIIETYLTPTVDMELFIDVNLDVAVDVLLPYFPVYWLEFKDWEVQEYVSYDSKTSEEYKICVDDCCTCNIELLYLNRVGGMEKVKGCTIEDGIDTQSDEFFHDQSDKFGELEFVSVNNLHTKGFEIEFDYSKPNMRAKVLGLITASVGWVIIDDKFHPISIERGKYTLDKVGEKVFSTVKIKDGYVNRRQHIYK